MDESLDTVGRTPEPHDPDRINPAGRSNPDKKDNGFSNALKEKMKEKLKERALGKDQVILHEDGKDTEEERSDDEDTGEKPSQEENREEKEAVDDEDLSADHIDLKA
ncbi:MAG: hypothetical protein JSW34_08620 [Candidatus Zixiibacteriota bacterium]|nr:MAG: hypothetical protein JSW34_08620 [candidate division Zixibacteria bacterium]